MCPGSGVTGGAGLGERVRPAGRSCAWAAATQERAKGKMESERSKTSRRLTLPFRAAPRVRLSSCARAHALTMCRNLVRAALFLAVVALAAGAASETATPIPLSAVASIPWTTLETRDHHHAAVLAAKVGGGRRVRAGGTRRRPRSLSEARAREPLFRRFPRSDSAHRSALLFPL